MATIYKKIPVQEVANTQISLATSNDKIQAMNIITTFVNLFKDKHLS
jgi:ACT domain-containing protein